MKLMIPALTFLVRHCLFVVLAMIVGCVVWTVVYFVLFGLALVANQGLGSPLVFPAGILLVVVSCGLLGWGVFAPASAIGAVVCALLRLPRMAAIPVVWVAAFIFSYWLYRAFIDLGTTHSMPPTGTVLKNFGMFLSVPLGAYWWLTEGPGAIFDSFQRWFLSWFSR